MLLKSAGFCRSCRWATPCWRPGQLLPQGVWVWGEELLLMPSPLQLLLHLLGTLP